MAITSISGTRSATQSAWELLQQEQARQFAERAAQNARALQSRASDAQGEANRAQQYALTLKVKAGQAQSIAVQADRSVRAAESSAQIGPQVIDKVTQATQHAAQTVPAEATPQQPTVNTQGETIGTLINVTA